MILLFEGESGMHFLSTRNENCRVTSAQAIVQGLSEEGGLFVPCEFPNVNLEQVCKQSCYAAMAAFLMETFLTDYSTDFLMEAASQAYKDSFAGKAAFVQKVTNQLFALELWHGPTSAFKDYALQLMPKLLVEGKRILGHNELTYILVATSGDTGKAALEGYKNLPGVQITVFYPYNGTSEIQRLQMATQQGNNVSVYAVQGNFDDVQSSLKQVFKNQSIHRILEEKNVHLSSANSINLGRLIPQIVYYFWAYKQLVERNEIQIGDEVNFCVPTGNFGDILSGYYAKQMGLPVHKLICASNKNNVLTEFFKTGRYNAKREFYKTSSPSMDILISSNLERLLYHITNDSQKVINWMAQLSENGYYEVDGDTLRKIQEVFAADYADDETTAEQIRYAFEQEQYLCDPHTAVAFYVVKKYQMEYKDNAPMVILSTASPFKFSADVMKALNQPMGVDEFETMNQLGMHTNSEVPISLGYLKNLPERFSNIITVKEIIDIVQNVL